MFESICVTRQSDVGIPFDLGLLAEALVFYQRVHLVADGDMLKSLLRVCGPEPLLALLEEGSLSLIYVQNLIGSLRINDNTPDERHDFALIESPVQALQEVLPKFMKEVVGRPGKGRRLAKRFSPFITTERYDKSVVDGARADLRDNRYVKDSVSKLLRYLVPEYELPNPFDFTVGVEGDKLRVETNIDFAKANEFYHRRVPSEHSSIDKDFLLVRLAGLRGDLQFWARVSSDIAVSPTNSILATCKFGHLVRERENAQEKLTLFQEFVFTEGRAIREAVNSGHRTFEEIVKLARATRKFKEWLRDKAHDQDLLKEYCREVNKVEWADKLPTKSLRWLFFTGAGILVGAVTHPLVGAAASAAIGATDAFLTERLIKGWKPNQFVAGALAEFLKPNH